MRYYFDYNASAPMPKQVKNYMVSVLDKIGNPSSIHYSGRESKKILENARSNIAELIECEENNIIFTSGATEANNLALNGFKNKIVSSIEHESIRNQKNVTLIEVDRHGYINLEMLNNVLVNLNNKSQSIVSVMFANNETGIIQPIDKVREMTKKFGIVFHSDAVQAVGRIDISFKQLGIDMMTLSSHKIGGPLGAGALVLASKKNMQPLFYGGQQEESLRSGTEPLLCIAGFGEAARSTNIRKMRKVKELRDYLENELKKLKLGIKIIGNNSKRLPNTVMINVPNIKADTLLIALDLEGFETSTGSACSSGKVEPSFVLKQMGFNNNVAASSIRLSLGYENSFEDIKKFIDTLLKIYRRINND